MESNFNLERFDIFPVPVYAIKLQNVDEINSYLERTAGRLELEDGHDKTNYCETGYTTFKKHDNILSHDECQTLLELIGNAVFTIHQNTGLTGGVYLQNSWLSINRKHSYHERHNHLPSTWSGVYYVKANTDDANLTFVNNNLRSHWPFCQLEENNMDNSANAMFSAETARLYIFPGYVEHMVEEQLVQQDRITLSFNFGVKFSNTEEQEND